MLAVINFGGPEMVATTITPARTGAGYFYVWMAGICAFIAFGGFAETYWLQLLAGTFVPSGPLLHLHAGLFSAWTILLLSQTWLAAHDRLDNHRAWGLVGISLATALIFVGVATAIHSMMTRTGADGEAARRFLIVPITAIGGFAILFAAAVANIGRPDWHKRFMLIATFSLLQAAVARVFFLLSTGGGPGARPGLGPAAPVATSLAGSGVVMVALQLIRVPLSDTPQWLAFAGSLGSFAR